MRPMDTDAATHAVQLRLLRALSGEARLGRALELSDELRTLRRAGIRARHPAYDDSAAEWALRRLTLGDDLFRRAWPSAPLLDP